MKEIGPEESKKLMLDILINVASFCDYHDIKYSLGYGTLIGAIRHKGFIPWDDDIDIIMMRDDYDRFVSTYKDERYKIISGEEQINHTHIRISDSKTVLKYTKPTPQSKFYKAGIWIDIFPIDKVLDLQEGYERHKHLLKKIINIRHVGDMEGVTVKGRVAVSVMKRFSKLLEKIIYRIMVRYNKKDTQTVANLALYYSRVPPFPIQYMSDYIDVEFEGHSFKAISQYDSWLKGIYGDYMQLPPEDERVAHHYFTAFYKE